MATLRELKGRIGSVASSEKITGAMKMISSAKMHKAEGELRRQHPFRNNIQKIIRSLLSTNADIPSPLFSQKEIKNITVLVWGSDEGLCGAYNINIYKQLVRTISQYRQAYGQQTAIEVIPIGNKMVKVTSKLKMQGVTVTPVVGLDAKADADDIAGLHQTLIDSYCSDKTDKVDLLYMQFKSVARQTLTLETILPLEAKNIAGEEKNTVSADYIFEPDTQTVMQEALPLYMLSTLTEIFTQNRASQQAARVMAMQSANDNAKKLLEQLQLEFNKLRQQSITNELLDIVGGQVR